MFVINLEEVFNREGSSIKLDRAADLSDIRQDDRVLFPEPVKITGCIRNVAEVVFMDATIEADEHTICDRCACDLVRHLTIPMEHTFVTALENEEDDDFIVIPDMVLDLDALSREDLLLDLPSKVLCREDCKGICPQCGKNLNEGPCNCKEPVDPRLEGLLSLLDDNE